MEDKTLEEECVPDSSICALFFKQEAKLITFPYQKKKFGQQNSTLKFNIFDYIEDINFPQNELNEDLGKINSCMYHQ